MFECPVIALVRATVRARCEALTREQIDAALAQLGAEPVGGRAPNGEELYPQATPAKWLYGAFDSEASALADEEWPRAWLEGAERIEASEAEIQANQHAYCVALLALAEVL